MCGYKCIQLKRGDTTLKSILAVILIMKCFYFIALTEAMEVQHHKLMIQSLLSAEKSSLFFQFPEYDQVFTSHGI